MHSKYRYGVILDAGSSGTRVHIYRWLKTAVARAIATKEQLHQLPIIRTKNKKWTLKAHPGISTFGGKPAQVGKEHLKELLDFATGVVPKSEVAETPIFMLATAGMRLLEPQPRNALLAEVCKYTRSHTKFHLPDCDEYIQVISGETEGMYGWIAANYLVGGFNGTSLPKEGFTHDTYGFLDMGGASAQIAFAPNKTETEKHANDLQLLRMRTIDGAPTNHRVFVTSFLHYGAKEAHRRYLENLTESNDLPTMKNTIPEPCLPKDLQLNLNGTIIDPSVPSATNASILYGTGEFSACLDQTKPLLDLHAACPDEPCLFHGVHVPAIDFSLNHFIGVSNFWHGTHEIFEMGHRDRAYDLTTYQERVTQFCEMEWGHMQGKLREHAWGRKVDEESVLDVCFKASWIINLLHEGIGIPRVGLEASSSSDPSDSKNKDVKQNQKGSGPHSATKEVIDNAAQEGYLAPFQAVNKINDVEVAWVLGKMVLYASSQIPPLGIPSSPSPPSKVKGKGDTGTKQDRPIKAVGFSKNYPDASKTLPKDFQYGSAEPDVFTPDFSLADYGPEPDDDADLVLEATGEFGKGAAASSSTGGLRGLLGRTGGGRLPGYALFLLILVAVGVLMMGRERRSNVLRRVLRPFGLDKDRGGYRSSSSSLSAFRKRRRDGKFPFNLPFTSSAGEDRTKYERLMEEGGENGDWRSNGVGEHHLAHPADFELANISASSSSDDDGTGSSASASSGRSGRGNGNGALTPRRGVGASPHPHPEGDDGGLRGAGQGLGLGLGSGVDKEREGEGSRSRAGSPGKGRGEKRSVE